MRNVQVRRHKTAVLLAIAAAIAPIAGCGSGSSSGADAGTPAAEPAPTPEPAPAASPSEKMLQTTLNLVRGSSRPYSDAINSVKVEGSTVVIETSIYNDAEGKDLYGAVCNVFAGYVGSDIDRVRVYGPGGGFAACDPF